MKYLLIGVVAGMLQGCESKEKKTQAQVSSQISADGHSITFQIDEIPARSTVELPSGKIIYMDEKKESK